MVSMVVLVSFCWVSTFSTSAYTTKIYSLDIYDIMVILDNNKGCYIEQYGDDGSGNWTNTFFYPEVSSTEFTALPLYNDPLAPSIYKHPFVKVYPNLQSQLLGLAGGYSSFIFDVGNTGADFSIYDYDEIENARYLSLYFEVYFQYLEIVGDSLGNLTDLNQVISEFPARFITPFLYVICPDGQQFSIYSDTNKNGSSIENAGLELADYWIFDIYFTPEQIEHMTPGTKFRFCFQWTGKPNWYFDLLFGFDTNACFYEYTLDYNAPSGGGTGTVPPSIDPEYPETSDNPYEAEQNAQINNNKNQINDLKDKMDIVPVPNGPSMNDDFINGVGNTFDNLSDGFRNSSFYSFLVTLCVPAVSIGILGFILYGKSD